MSLPLPTILGALAQAQLGTVAPPLAGTYPGGSAMTIGLLLVLLAQDAATMETHRARTMEQAGAILADAGVAVSEGHDERLAALDRLLAETRDPVLERRVLDLYVAMSEAAFVLPPVLVT